MGHKISTQQIIKDLDSLPDEKISEVIDFVQFLKQRKEKCGISIQDIGLTKKEAIDLRTRLASFENDWNAPGMEAYDDL